MKCGFGPDICQYLWIGELNEMVLGFWCICVWAPFIVNNIELFHIENILKT